MLTGITDQQQLKKAYDVYARRLQAGAKRIAGQKLGWQGGGGEYTLYYHLQQRFWCVIDEDVPNRFWFGYGLGDPSVGHAPGLVCEINPPKSGVYRTGGMLLDDGSGGVVLAHNGMVGGGRKGISKTSFFSAYRGSLERVDRGDGVLVDAVVIGRLDAPDLLDNIARFVVDVNNFKQSIKKSEIQ